MFLYWVTCSFLASGLVWYHNHRLQDFPPNTTSAQSEDSFRDRNSETTNLKRNSPNSFSDQDSMNIFQKKSVAKTHSSCPKSAIPSANTSFKSKDTQNAVPSSNQGKEDTKSAVSSSLSIVTRKHFHILAIVTFFPGIALDCQMANMAGTCAIIVFAMLEVSCMRCDLSFLQ